MTFPPPGLIGEPPPLGLRGEVPPRRRSTMKSTGFSGCERSTAFMASLSRTSKLCRDK